MSNKGYQNTLNEILWIMIVSGFFNLLQSDMEWWGDQGQLLDIKSKVWIEVRSHVQNWLIFQLSLNYVYQINLLKS